MEQSSATAQGPEVPFLGAVRRLRIVLRSPHFLGPSTLPFQRVLDASQPDCLPCARCCTWVWAWLPVHAPPPAGARARWLELSGTRGSGAGEPPSLPSAVPALLAHSTSASPGPPSRSCTLLGRPLRQTAEWGHWLGPCTLTLTARATPNVLPPPGSVLKGLP